MKRAISVYKNGNYNVALFEDGTKIRYNKENDLIPDFPESMDMKITNYCPYGCPQCHENSSPEGKYGKILHHPFIKTLHKGTELALGGGAVTFHPDLIPFLEELKEYGIFPSITINQQEFFKSKIDFLYNNNLIYGLGISFTSFDYDLWNEALQYPNMVVHLIAGYHDKSVFEWFAHKKAKILILGYKNWGRGREYRKNNKEQIGKKILEVEKLLPHLIENCKVVSFDNLAIKQLNVQKFMDRKDWEQYYMGDDGQYTLYVDMVEEKCAKSSTSEERFPLSDFDKLWKNVKKVDVLTENHREMSKQCIECWNRDSFAGQAFTTTKCEGCGLEMTFATTDIDKYCLSCALKKNICRHCGKEMC